MVAGKKRIKSNIRSAIDATKGNIISSFGWFDVDGYIGRTAIRELRASGYEIRYDNKRGSYRVVRPLLEVGYKEAALTGGRHVSLYAQEDAIVVFEREHSIKEGWAEHKFTRTETGLAKAIRLFNKLTN